MNSEYKLILKQVEALISAESDPIANAANISSLVYHAIDEVNWVGFYYLRSGELVLGPFSGQPACTRIPVGKGVCGTAFARQETQVVADVHSFEGHIACDSASESEVVVPFKTNKLSGVFDIDSPKLARFNADEVELFEAISRAYTNSLN